MAARRKAKRARPGSLKARRTKTEMVYYQRLIFLLVGATGLGLFWKGLWDVTRSLAGGESLVIGLGLVLATAIGHKVVK